MKFNKKTRKITMECWPRNVDITGPEPKPYPGWPSTIHQLDNYGRKAVGYLPTIKVEGMSNPVLQVIDEETDEIVYTLRVSGTEFRPKVFKAATYTIKVGEPGTDRVKVLKGIESSGMNDTRTVEVSL